MRKSLALCVLLSAVLTGTAWGGGYESKTLEPVVEQFTHRPVAAVWCEGRLGGGAADPELRWIYLDRAFCNPLAALVNGVELAPRRQGVGLIVLAHEGWHLRGSLQEARTECRAFQTMDDLADMMGVRPAWRDRILRYATIDHYQLVRSTPRYRDARCRENGPWDDSPLDGVWP